MQTLTAEQFKKKYGETGLSQVSSVTKQGALQETGEDMKQVGRDVSKSFTERRAAVQESKRAEQTGVETLYQTAGQAAGFVSDVFGSLIKGGVKAALPQSAEEKIKTGVTTIAEPLVNTDIVKSVIAKYNTLDERTKRNLNATLGIGSLALDVALLGGGKKVAETGIKTGVELATKATELTKGIAGETIDLTKRATGKLLKLVETPPPTPLGAVGQIAQGTTKDIAPVVRGLSTLDTTGVKTYSQLSGVIEKQITKQLEKVDADLALDTTRRPLSNLVIKETTTGGKTVVTKPVKNALDQLNELYTKTGDTVNAANIKELATKATKEGLTNQEVNDLAKIYGSEFGSKAFSKIGEPLTSVNAQLYENTRTQLKTLARQGIKGKEAKKADKLVSSLIKTQTLVKKNIEAVNKITQRITERGLVEKIGYQLSKYSNLLTGGSLRGLVGGLLPRGVGYKVMNAIDVEKALEKNLKIIQDAIKTKSDNEVVKILKGLNVKSSSR